MSPLKLALLFLYAIAMTALVTASITVVAMRPSEAPNRATNYATAVAPDARCEPSSLLGDVQRDKESMSFGKVDAALCYTRDVVFFCHASYATGAQPACDPILTTKSQAPAQAPRSK